MKKLLFLVLTLLLLSGVSFAASIPEGVDATTGPELWLTVVYNNSSNALDVGDVVIWDMDASTGDNDNYVNTTTTANYTGAIAGVVYPSAISAASVGSIVIRGPVAVDVLINQGTGLDGYLCTSGTAGSAQDCTTATNGSDFARVTAVTSSLSAVAYVMGD